MKEVRVSVRADEEELFEVLTAISIISMRLARNLKARMAK